MILTTLKAIIRYLLYTEDYNMILTTLRAII